MEAKILERVFTFKDGTKERVLTDPNPNLSPEEVLDIYSNQYPALINVQIKKPKVKDEKLVYEAVTIAGTKG